jgi:ATP-binding cassette subfamily F protein uup
MLRPDSRATTLVLGALIAIAPLSMDIYLPSMPSMTRALGATVDEVQLTISVYMFGWGVAQLFAGPVSDRFGRRPALLWALVVYTLASLACALARDVVTLIAARFVQALSMATVAVVPRAVVRDLDLRVMRGDRLGLIGPNGAGKSTLLKLILGTLEPDAGEVRFGSQISVAYFDQLRAQLDLDATVAGTVSPNSDWVGEGDQRRHVISYLGDFLFPAQRADSPVRMLSGGERNRLMLARLFARPANVLVMDEPTNDLDIESLELLEQTLQDYSGTLLLVSHDRTFLDNVVTQVLAPLGDGRWREYVGGYSDWLRQRPQSKPSPQPAPARGAEGASPGEGARKPAKMSYKETRELEQLPLQIETLEAEQRALAAAMSGPEYHKRGGEQMRKDAARATDLEQALEVAFARWAELDAKKNALGRT